MQHAETKGRCVTRSMFVQTVSADRQAAPKGCALQCREEATDTHDGHPRGFKPTKGKHGEDEDCVACAQC